MSTFQVKLVQGDQSNLDSAVTGGFSKQRSMYVAGPNRIPRELKDGDTFTDCNYWKRFAVPQVAASQAFITVLSDDGSIFVDGSSETFPRVYNKVVALASTFTTAGNKIDLLADTGSFAVYTQITVSGDDVKVRLNGSASAVFDVTTTTGQVFNPGDFEITTLEFDNTAGAGAATVQVLFGIRSVCNS